MLAGNNIEESPKPGSEADLTIKREDQSEEMEQMQLQLRPAVQASE